MPPHLTVNIALHILLLFMGLLTFGLSWLAAGDRHLPDRRPGLQHAFHRRRRRGDAGYAAVRHRGAAGLTAATDYFQAFLMTALFLRA